MVHHEWRLRGSVRLQKTEAVPGGLSVSQCHRHVSSNRRGSSRPGEHPFPGRRVQFGGADAGEAGEGRHPTSALGRGRKKRKKKKKKKGHLYVGVVTCRVTVT